MLGFKSKPAVTVNQTSVSLAKGERYDDTLRPICFGLSNKLTKETAAKVGAENFKKYEYLLYIGAQLSRLAYSDTGIMWNVIEKSLGMSNDVVNKVISAYDKQFAAQKKNPSSAPGSEGGRPMESYSLSVSNSAANKYATYISTPADLTCFVLNASKIKANPNSILQPTDVFVTFKGSSTIKNFWHDLKSQFTASDLGALLETTGIKVTKNEGKNLVTGAFVKPIVKSWNILMKALSEHVIADGTRLFLCGHSLGGAYCTLFAFILAEGKASGTLPIMNKVKNIHILSYGAPTLLSDSARNTFNRHLESGFMTLDRVVSQKIAARTSAVALTGIGAGPNDIIPSIPVGFTHPGFRPLATNFRPEANGRPYSMDNIRKFYGVSSNTRYRDAATWPFSEDISLGDWKNSGKLNELVKGIIGIEPPVNKDPAAEVEAQPEDPGVVQSQAAGFREQKKLYAAATQNHVPDFVSIAGSNYAMGFAHMEYLGMFFAGGARLLGMKNPGYGNRSAYFNLTTTGVQLTYVEYKNINPGLNAVSELTKLPADESGDENPESPPLATPLATPLAAPLAAPKQGGYRRACRTRRKAREMKKISKSRRR